MIKPASEFAQVERVCHIKNAPSDIRIGLHLADASVWASCAMTLAAFDIDKVIHDGKVIEVVPEYTSGTIRCARLSSLRYSS